MKLSQVPIARDGLVRDCEFSSLGLLGDRRTALLTFVTNAEQLENLRIQNGVSGVITHPDVVDAVDTRFGVCISTDPKKCFIEIHNWLAENSDFYGKRFPTIISEKATIHPSAFVSRSCVKIGDYCEVGPKAIVLERTILDDSVTVGPNSVIGSRHPLDSVQDAQSRSIHACGWVFIRRGVDIHANCCVANPVFGGKTEIGEYTKLDNLVVVEPNSTVGRRCFLVASCVVGESAQIGDDVWIGPNATVCEGVRVGNNSFVTIGSVVANDVSDGQRVSGNYAIDHAKFIELMRRIR